MVRPVRNDKVVLGDERRELRLGYLGLTQDERWAQGGFICRPCEP